MSIESEIKICEGQQTLFDGQIPKVGKLDEVAKANTWGGVTISRVSDPYYSQLADIGRVTVWEGGAVNISSFGIRTPIPRYKNVGSGTDVQKA